MKIFAKFLILFFGVSLLLSAEDTGRQVVDFNSNWKFSKGEANDAYKIEFNDSDWQIVKVPHDWAIYGPFDPEGNPETGKLPWRGEGWYRKTFNLDQANNGDRVYLLFDGVMAFPKVYVNGKLAGEWDYGYNSFYLDITDFVKFDNENLVAVYVDTRKHESRWYPGAGIYRKVQMIVTSPIHVDIWGTKITTPSVEEKWSDVRVATMVNNDSDSDSEVKLESIFISPDGYEFLSDKKEATIEKNSNYEFEQWITLTEPELWDIDNPALYKVKTLVKVDDKVVDTYETTFGVRSFKFTEDDGFYLNNRRVQFKGVNLHHDQGPLGAAFNKRAMQRQLEIMKEMGCNSIRTSHNVPAPELLELCDEMGLLVIDEIYDKWDKRGDLPEGEAFFESAERNMTNFIKRDRNHPSIILWSIGNEIHDIQSNQPGSIRKMESMVLTLKKYDFTRPITMVNDMPTEAKWRLFDYYDVHSFNYGRRYLPFREAEPSKPVIITESASTISTRGFYKFPLPKEKTDYFTDELQISSYDMNAPFWAEPPDLDWDWQENDEYVCGEFVWTGFDYIGEPTPYNYTMLHDGTITLDQTAKSSYFGIVDLVGIPKDRFYLYRSYWAPENKTVHLLPHWNWEGLEGEDIPVFVYTNGDKAELFVNGKSQGFREKKPTSDSLFERYRLMWNNVKYEPGELKAVAYKEGKVIGEDVIVTAGAPAKIKLTVDRTDLNVTGDDLAYILVEAYDEDGNICPLADNEINLEVEGVGTIEGVGNGNPQSLEPFKANKRKLFYGKAMLIVGTKGEDGKIKVKASSGGLESAEVVLNVK